MRLEEEAEPTRTIVQPLRPEGEVITRVAEHREPVPLWRAPSGVPLRVEAIQADKATEKRLLSMGVPLGTVVEIVHRRGGAVVLAVGGARLAVGHDMARRILVEPL
ncbi:MAG: ferrous iron transport protein A [Gammaproteobacteria bacterium]|nr:MAG: ferrous iron transport protein A [Gammaproteobacteria bacterium]